MPDINQPFVAISGLAVGVTATTVITDIGSLPVAVSSFNGLTGAVTGVTTSVANTFTALQSFSAGISASGATLGTLSNNLRITSNSVIASSGFTFGATGARLAFPGLTGSLNGGYLWLQDGFFQIGGSNPVSGNGSFYYNPGTERLYLFGYADFNHSYNYQASRAPLRLNVGPNHTAPILATYVQTAEGTQLGSGYSSTNMVAGIDNKGVLFSYAGLSASGATFAANSQAATYTETTNRIRMTNNARSWFL
jgi:hypothetical protein